MDMMDWMDTISGYVNQGIDNFKRNAVNFGSMSMKEWLRIITIVGAYLLIRPYFAKWAENVQARQHEKELHPAEMAAAAKPEKTAISANSLRGQVQLPVESDSEEETAEGKPSGANWGKKARRRQRAMIRRIIEQDEKLRREMVEYDDDEDKDIEQYLT
jgi:hypothetical protein